MEYGSENHSNCNWSVGNDTNSFKRQFEGNWNSCKGIANPEISATGNSKNFEEGSWSLRILVVTWYSRVTPICRNCILCVISIIIIIIIQTLIMC